MPPMNEPKPELTPAVLEAAKALGYAWRALWKARLDGTEANSPAEWQAVNRAVAELDRSIMDALLEADGGC